MRFGMWRILWVLMAAEVVSGFETSMVLAGVAAWLRIYGNPIGVGWIISSYLLVSAAAAALCGRLGDIYGRKRVLLIVLACAGFGSLISAVAPNLEWVVAGRALQGLAGAIIPLCYGLAREHIDPEKVPSAIGFIVATASAAAGIGVLVGGILTDRFGPQSIFQFSAAAAFIVFGVVAVALPTSPSHQPLPGSRIDWLGGILFAPGVAALLVVVSEAGRWGWTNPLTLALAAGGAALLAIWVWHEQRQEEPLIDVRLLANRQCALANLVMACAALGVMQLTQLTSFLLQQAPETGAGLGTNATFVGLLKFPALAAGILSSIIAGWLAGRLGGRLPMIVGCALMTAATVIGAVEHQYLTPIIVAIVLGSLGVTATYTAVPAVIIAASPPDRTSEATGMMAVTRAISQAIGAQILAILLASSTVTGSGGRQFPTNAAYSSVFWFMAAVSFVGILLSLPLARGKPVARPSSAEVGLAG